MLLMLPSSRMLGIRLSDLFIKHFLSSVKANILYPYMHLFLAALAVEPHVAATYNILVFSEDFRLTAFLFALGT